MPAGPRSGRSALRSSDRLPGDVDFGPPGASGKVLDRVTVPVARREVHRAEVAAGAQRGIDQADASKNSAQSNVAIVRMLVITLRTVTFIAAWR